VLVEKQWRRKGASVLEKGIQIRVYDTTVTKPQLTLKT